MNKKVSKNYLGNFFTFFPKGKKGMEMWQLLLILMAVILLLFFVAWYSALGNDLGDLFGKLGDLF